MSFVICPSCGNQIAVQAGVNLYQCPYCGKTFSVQQFAPAYQQQAYNPYSQTAPEHVLYEAHYASRGNMTKKIIEIVLLVVCAFTFGWLVPFVGTGFFLVLVFYEGYSLYEEKRCIQNQKFVVTNKRVEIRVADRIRKQDKGPIWKRRQFVDIDIPISEYAGASVEDMDYDLQAGTVIVSLKNGSLSKVVCVLDPYAAVKRMDEIVRMGA